MTVYLNSIEMGKGIYGAEATAKYKFGTTGGQTNKGRVRIDCSNLAKPNTLRLGSPLAVYKEKTVANTTIDASGS